MAVERAILLIADIGGYTKFMTAHRMNLAHAQDAIARLLESVIDAAGRFSLAKLEGDAAFFRGPVDLCAADVIRGMRLSFLRRKRALIGDRMCTCDTCMQLENLNLKFVIHEGELIRQRVKRNEELAGVDVILVHRMLKNDVPLKEYALATSDARRHVDPIGPAADIVHELEGIGSVPTCYVDLTSVQPPAVDETPPGKITKLFRKIAFEARSLPYILGLKEACKGWRGTPGGGGDAQPTPSSTTRDVATTASADASDPKG